MAVALRTRRKYQRTARARIELGVDALTRLLNYDEKHPAMNLFTEEQVIEVQGVITLLNNALQEVVTISG